MYNILFFIVKFQINNKKSISLVELKFQKDKEIELMNRIKGMFRYVSFSFMSEQLNGNAKITCVCTVDGTPYPDVNNAGKINAGIDIINAICRSKGVTAPIFIDNRESINFLLGTNSQIVNLSVSLHNNLVKSVESGLETEYVEL